MKKNHSDIFIALGVLLCSGVLLGALIIALSGWHPGRKGRTLQIDYPDITGINKHSVVRYAGAPAGQVIEVRLLSDSERIESQGAAVRVTVELFDSVPMLPDDVRASLGSDTLLSEKFIALSAGSPDRPKLPQGAILRGAAAASLDSLIDAVGPFLQSADRLVVQLEKTLLGFDSVVEKTGAAVDTFRTGIGDALPRISKLADELTTTASSATTAVKNVDRVVTEADPIIKRDLEKLEAALDALGKTMGTADQMLTSTDKQLSARMQELSVVLQNLKVATTHAKALTKSLGEKPNRIIFSGKPQPLPSEQEILRSTKPVPVR
jgi:ABC-type transporter Mla subunit MlaD